LQKIRRKSSILNLCLILGLFFTGIATPSFAIEEIKEGDILSLDDCIEIALKNNPNIQISKNNVKLIESRVGQAKSDYFPTLGASGGYTGNTIDIGNNYGGNDYYYSAGVSLRQLIFNFGKTNANIKMQKFNKIASEFDLTNTILQTAYNVKNAYYGVLASRAKIDIAKSNLEINKRQHEQIKAFFEEGLKSRIDFVNAEVNLSNSKIELIGAETDYENTLVKLNNAMYVAYAPNYSIKNTETFNLKENWADVKFLNIGNYKKLEEEINTKNVEPLNFTNDKSSTLLSTTVEKNDILKDYTFIPLELSFEEALDFAKENRPDFKSYLATKDAMTEALKYAKREYLPNLSASAGYTWRESSAPTTSSFNYGATIDITSFNPMKTKYKIDEAETQLEIAKENINLIEKNIFFEVQDAYINMVQFEKQIPLYKKRVYQALENLELPAGRYGEKQDYGSGNFGLLQRCQQDKYPHSPWHGSDPMHQSQKARVFQWLLQRRKRSVFRQCGSLCVYDRRPYGRNTDPGWFHGIYRYCRTSGCDPPLRRQDY